MFKFNLGKWKIEMFAIIVLIGEMIVLSNSQNQFFTFILKSDK